MDIKPIKTEADYDRALTMIDRLMGAAPGTRDGDDLEVLVTLVEALRGRTLADGSAGSDLGDRARHGGSRLPSEGSRGVDRIPAARVRGAQPPAPPHPGDDPCPVGRMESTRRPARARVRAGNGPMTIQASPRTAQCDSAVVWEAEDTRIWWAAVQARGRRGKSF